jgi:activator-of-BECN1-regulated-autophagy protein 1
LNFGADLVCVICFDVFSGRNAFCLLVQREICPRTKHTPKRRWGEDAHWNSNSSSSPKTEQARDAKRGLISW